MLLSVQKQFIQSISERESEENLLQKYRENKHRNNRNMPVTI
ncbi:MAG: hypothetical protein ACOCXG_01380 [Nanoarchaeota archaeon]